MKKVIHKNLNHIVSEPTTHLVGSKKTFMHGFETETMLTHASFGSLEKGEFIDNHQHPTMEEFFFFTKGRIKIVIENVEYLCKKDDFFKIPKATNHSFEALTDATFIYWGIAI